MESGLIGAAPWWSLLLIVAAVLFLRAIVLIGAASLFLRSPIAQARRVYRHAFSRGQLKKELAVAIPVLLLDAATFTLFRSLGWISFADATPARTVLTFALMFVWFEVWFYATHRALHHPKLYFLHAQHHVARVTHPLTALSFGLVERGLLLVGVLGFAAVASRVVPFVLPGLAAYLVLNLTLNVLAHLNVELMPASYGRSWPSRLFISTTFHAMHHARFTNHYGLFTTVLDRTFSTVWEDYPEVHARAATRNGLARLGERISAREDAASAAELEG